MSSNGDTERRARSPREQGSQRRRIKPSDKRPTTKGDRSCIPIYAHLLKSKLSARVSASENLLSTSAVVLSVLLLWLAPSLKNVAVLARRVAILSLGPGDAGSVCPVIPIPPGPCPLVGGVRKVEVVDPPVCFSRSFVISRSRFRHEETCSPPSRLAQTREKTEALRASIRTNDGKLFPLTILISAAGEI